MGKCVGFPQGRGGHEVPVSGGGHEGGGKNKAMWVKRDKVILVSPN